ncbi:hypothetical protein AcW1_001011 [Taiwanofungus camphoratus]|nr:hypothetical protein AcW2_000492 [Antrodia cinnamomea]KAI0936889.1 hypothetical protein AcV5_004917 [Antrodia cinnamomea]KAI0962106.1 hypothetical protein AcV7_001023 [Antrodia cinnamomea]KAI0964114.1 hypothetical protein AcW1_001011 [Antrodia cinnamomea]
MSGATTSKTARVTPSVYDRLLSRLRSTAWFVFQHVRKHTGVGIICSVAYFDPGNWGVDLQAGSQFGYKLLFVVLLAGIFAVYMQVLASRLGCVTGLDLASHCRLLLHNRPKHTRLWRRLVLYPLYALSEIAIISTDLAELLGSAIALCLLFPKLPLWAGVLLTASDVLLLLALRDPLRGQPVKLFELLIAALVFTVLVCMAVIISKADVHWGHAFDGFIPSSSLVKHGGLYTSVGILGATVMPHSLFLGSAFATQERECPEPEEEEIKSLLLVESNYTLEQGPLPPKASKLRPREIARTVAKSFRAWFQITSVEEDANQPLSHADRENNSLAFVRTHLYHGIVDMVISLLGIAVVINALILMLASAVFYFGSDQMGSESPATLFDTYDLLHDSLGKPAAILFALALLASGQSSSIIATLAGQAVSEGFIHWRVSPVLRRLFTRCLGLIPSTAVAAALGRSGISTLLVVSQVVLSIILPFIVFPLILLTSSKTVMSVKKPPISSTDETAMSTHQPALAGSQSIGDTEAALEEKVDFSNGKIMTVIGWIIWIVIVLANVYAIVTLAMGEGS